MRKAFVEVVDQVMQNDESLILMLGDIGVHGFRKTFENFPTRTYNIGILEQAMVSVASGLSKEGFIPVLHTIAPFMVERALEQIKVDFAYQKVRGNFVSVGASFDYAALGCTHHCPGDVGILLNVPDIQIVLPGSAVEFKELFLQAYANPHVTYFRLSENPNAKNFPVQFGKGKCVREGTKATIIAVGPILDTVLESCEGLDVEVIYITTVRPLDKELIGQRCKSEKILLVEPYYSGALLPELISLFSGRKMTFELAGVPHEFLSNYGFAQEHAERIGLTRDGIRKKLENLING